MHFIRDEDEYDYVVIHFTYYGSSINVSVQSQDKDLIFLVQNFISDEFGLNNPIIPVDKLRSLYLNPTIFIGRHFDEKANKNYNKLFEFLSLIGFNIKQGEEYTSNSIPEKVKTRINDQDIFIGLITGDKEHSWISSEAAYALGKQKHIILLVEEGLNYNPTILGRDLEQIRFTTGCAEKSFVKLLREFHSIKVKGL